MADFLNLMDKKRIAGKFNFNVLQSNKNRKDVVVPKGVTSATNIKDFSLAWERVISQNPASSQLRTRIDAYNRMDTYGALSSRALDAYADESLGVMRSHLAAIKFSINDSEIERKVRKVLDYNDMFTNVKVRDDVRNMCKFGDFAYIFKFYINDEYYDDEEDEDYNKQIRLTESITNKKNKISKPLRPEQINIEYLPPESYELEAFRGQVFSLKAIGIDNEEYMPWEFSYFRIGTRTYFPRGESVLEKARVPFEVLSVSEQLMYMCRASKVERLVIKYPEGEDLTTDLENVIQTRGMMENARWFNQFNNPSGPSALNRNSDTALNTILFVPDSLTFEPLKNSIDVASIEDVNYLKEKFISALGLAKGFLLADGSTPGGDSLIEQDLVFARKLPYIQSAYVEGVKDLLTKICFYLGADLNTLKVNVMIESPHRLTDRSIEQNNKGLEFVKSQIAFYKEMDPNYELKPAQWLRMIQKAGLDPEIYSIPVTLKAHKPGGGGEADMSGVSDLGDIGGGEMGAEGGATEPEGFDSKDIGTSPFAENKAKYLSEKLEDHANNYISLGENYVFHSGLYRYFVKAK